MEAALRKADDHNINCTVISPIDTVEIKARSILIKEIPLGTSKEAIKAHFEEFGIISKLTWSVVGLWQKATIEFQEKESAEKASLNWSWLIGKDAVRIIPEGNVANTLETRDKFTLKLTYLPPGTTANDIWEYICKLGGRTCKIPRNATTYQRLRFAIVNFASKGEMEKALLDRPLFKEHQLQWVVPDTPACRRCGDKNHTGRECNLLLTPRQQVINDPKYKNLAKLYQKKHVPISTPANFGGLSWAQVISKKANNKTDTKVKHQNQEVKEKEISIETRLTRLEEAIGKILTHLNIPKTPTQENTTINKEKEAITQTTPTATGSNQKGKNKIELPAVIIERIISSDNSAKDQIKEISQAFTTYHHEIEDRILALENDIKTMVATINTIRSNGMDTDEQLFK
jgi:hypothetical protein